MGVQFSAPTSNNNDNQEQTPRETWPQLLKRRLLGRSRQEYPSRDWTDSVRIIPASVALAKDEISFGNPSKGRLGSPVITNGIINKRRSMTQRNENTIAKRRWAPIRRCSRCDSTCKRCKGSPVGVLKSHAPIRGTKIRVVPMKSASPVESRSPSLARSPRLPTRSPSFIIKETTIDLLHLKIDGSKVTTDVTTFSGTVRRAGPGLISINPKPGVPVIPFTGAQVDSYNNHLKKGKPEEKKRQTVHEPPRRPPVTMSGKSILNPFQKAPVMTEKDSVRSPDYVRVKDMVYQPKMGGEEDRSHDQKTTPPENSSVGSLKTFPFSHASSTGSGSKGSVGDESKDLKVIRRSEPIAIGSAGRCATVRSVSGYPDIRSTELYHASPVEAHSTLGTESCPSSDPSPEERKTEDSQIVSSSNYSDEDYDEYLDAKTPPDFPKIDGSIIVGGPRNPLRLLTVGTGAKGPPDEPSSQTSEVISSSNFSGESLDGFPQDLTTGSDDICRVIPSRPSLDSTTSSKPLDTTSNLTQGSPSPTSNKSKGPLSSGTLSDSPSKDFHDLNTQSTGIPPFDASPSTSPTMSNGATDFYATHHKPVDTKRFLMVSYEDNFWQDWEDRDGLLCSQHTDFDETALILVNADVVLDVRRLISTISHMIDKLPKLISVLIRLKLTEDQKKSLLDMAQSKNRRLVIDLKGDHEMRMIF